MPSVSSFAVEHITAGCCDVCGQFMKEFKFIEGCYIGRHKCNHLQEMSNTMAAMYVRWDGEGEVPWKHGFLLSTVELLSYCTELILASKSGSPQVLFPGSSRVYIHRKALLLPLGREQPSCATTGASFEQQRGIFPSVNSAAALTLSSWSGTHCLPTENTCAVTRV